MWFFYALLSAITAALVAVFGKFGLQTIDPTLATTLRSLIMAFLLVCVSLVFKKFEGFSFSVLSHRDWLLIVLSGIAGASSWLFYFIALKLGLASHVAAVDRLSIVFVVLLSTLFLGEVLGWKSVLGSFLVVIGVFLISAK